MKYYIVEIGMALISFALNFFTILIFKILLH